MVVDIFEVVVDFFMRWLWVVVHCRWLYSADQKYASQKTRVKRAQENCAHASAFVTRASKTRLHQR